MTQTAIVEYNVTDAAIAEMNSRYMALEALKPDKEKLIAYAGSIIATVEPGLFSGAANAILDEAKKRILAVNRYVIKSAQEL